MISKTPKRLRAKTKTMQAVKKLNHGF